MVVRVNRYQSTLHALLLARPVLENFRSDFESVTDSVRGVFCVSFSFTGFWRNGNIYIPIVVSPGAFTKLKEQSLRRETLISVNAKN